LLCFSWPRNSRLFEFFVFVVLELSSKSLFQNGFLLLLVLNVDGNVLRKKGRLLNQLQVGIVFELAEQVNEGLFVVVVALNGEFVVLNALLAVEGDGSGLNLTLLEIDLVAAQNDGNVGSADTSNISVPVGDVLVSHSGSNIEHNDGSLASNIVAVTQNTELFLTGSVPLKSLWLDLALCLLRFKRSIVTYHVKHDLTIGSEPRQWNYIDTDGS
jgi:hypothetical protein